MAKNNKDFKREVKNFKRLTKSELTEIIFTLQEMNLALKEKIVLLERMLEERGDVIMALKSGHCNTDYTDNNSWNEELFEEDFEIETESVEELSELDEIKGRIYERFKEHTRY